MTGESVFDDAAESAAVRRTDHFPSHRDVWITAVVWLAILAMVAVIVPVWTRAGDWETRLIVTGLLAVSAIFSGSVLYGTSYTLEERELLVRSGPLRWRVPYDAITKVAPSRTLLSGPACSLDRLVISRNDRLLGLVISPIDRARFLEALASRSETFELREGQILRRNETQ